MPPPPLPTATQKSKGSNKKGKDPQEKGGKLFRSLSLFLWASEAGEEEEEEEEEAGQ